MTNKPNFEAIPYAGLIELTMSELSEHKVDSMAIVAQIDGKTDVFTAYWNTDTVGMATFAAHIQSDMLLEMVMRNARRIVDAAEEQEDDDGEDDPS